MIKYAFFIFLLMSNVLSSPSCQDYTNNCKKCNIFTNLCLQCLYDVLKPDKDGGCEPAKICKPGKNYCEECDKNNEICKTCILSYSPDEAGGCSTTENCEFSVRSTCKKCKENYVMIGDDSLGLIFCKPEDSEDFLNCKTINQQTGYCEECEKNYYLNSDDQKCTETENCKESIYGKCVSCKNGYYLDHKDKNKCKPSNIEFRYCAETEDGKTCSKCENSYYLDEEGKCVSTNYCSQSKNYMCSKCKEGYYLTKDYHYCVTTKNCDHSDKDSGACLSCLPLFYLDVSDERKCKSNQEDDDLKNCKKFEDKCVLCAENYYLGEDSKCSNTKYCAQSELNICQKCKDNYYLTEDNQCTSIKNCIHSYYESCSECKEGFYFNRYTSECEEATEEFKDCKIVNINGNKCEDCRDDFYIIKDNNDGKCFPNDEEGPSYKCSIAIKNGTQCIKCTKDYFLGVKDKKCTKIKKCAVSDENTCLECENDYCLDVKKGTCEYNVYPEEEEDMPYYKCAKTNKEGTKCEECVDGFTLKENGLCSDYSKCKEIKGGKCDKCLDIYFDPTSRITYCMNNDFGCVDTYDNNNCLRCDTYNFDNCTECVKGYELYESTKYPGFMECKLIEEEEELEE